MFYLAQSRNQIKPRACHIWLTLIRRLSHLNRSEDGLVKLSEFLQTLNMYHIRINEEVSANDTIFMVCLLNLLVKCLSSDLVQSKGKLSCIGQIHKVEKL